MRNLVRFIVLSVFALSTVVWACAVNPTVKAPGTVSATGNGEAHVRIFQGTATVAGQGVLRVSAAAQVQITGNAGAKTDQPNRKTGKSAWVVYKKFNGSAAISGQDVHVFLHGKNISLTAQGAGRAHFIGTGTYNIQTQGKSAENGHWAVRPKKAGSAPAPNVKNFWNSIRRVYGEYAFKNGKDDQEGDMPLD